MHEAEDCGNGTSKDDAIDIIERNTSHEEIDMLHTDED
jgi:hypothetical protein